MSIATLQAEFYPEPAGLLVHRMRANGVPRVIQQLVAAVASLRKWEGFLPGALADHGVRWKDGKTDILVDDMGNVWEDPATDINCALCQASVRRGGTTGYCDVCLLAPYTERCVGRDKTPYGVFEETLRPHLMIDALKKAVIAARAAAIEAEKGAPV